MSNINVCSGIVKRIFVETSDVTTQTRFTLIGNKTIYELLTTDFDIRKKLELTMPGDEIFFEYETSGLIFKKTSINKFNNMTLDKEISD